MKARHMQGIGDPDDPNGMVALMKKYLEWMEVHNYSPETVEVWMYYLGCFVRWADERGITRPGEVTTRIVERYQRYLYRYRKPNGDPLSFQTQRCRLVPLRAWFKWLSRENYVWYNPAADIEPPKLGLRLPQPLLPATAAAPATTSTHTPPPTLTRTQAGRPAAAPAYRMSSSARSAVPNRRSGRTHA